MKLTVVVHRMVRRTALGVAGGTVNVVGERRIPGEIPVEIFRLPIGGNTKDQYVIEKYYANPEGGVSTDDLWVWIEGSEATDLSIQWNLQLNHPPQKPSLPETTGDTLTQQTGDAARAAPPTAAEIAGMIERVIGGPTPATPSAATPIPAQHVPASS